MTIKPDLNGRIALVTGGSRGIGAAVAMALADAGAAVAVNYRERAAEAEAVVAGIKDKGGRAIAVAADVSQAAAVAKMIDNVATALGAIDILVNNAGMAIVRGIDDLTESRFRPDHRGKPEIGLSLHPGRAAGDACRRNGAASSISPPALRGAGAIGVHYNASKAGMEGLTRGHAARLVKEGITVNAVAPSLIETDMMRGRADLAARIPLGRLGQPDEVAQAVLMVLGNDYMTGQTIMLERRHGVYLKNLCQPIRVLILEERRLSYHRTALRGPVGRVSKNGPRLASWFETREDVPLTMRLDRPEPRPLQRRAPLLRRQRLQKRLHRRALLARASPARNHNALRRAE